MVGGSVVGRHVGHQRGSSTTIKEANGHTRHTTLVCGSESTVEVWEQVDLGSIPGTSSKNTGNGDTNIWFGVYDLKRQDDGSPNLQVERLTVTNDSSVDKESQKSHLICSSVVLQQSSSVVIADGYVGWALSDGRAKGSCESKSLQKHGCDIKIASSESEKDFLELPVSKSLALVPWIESWRASSVGATKPASHKDRERCFCILLSQTR